MKEESILLYSSIYSIYSIFAKSSPKFNPKSALPDTCMYFQAKTQRCIFFLLLNVVCTCITGQRHHRTSSGGLHRPFFLTSFVACCPGSGWDGVSFPPSRLNGLWFVTAGECLHGTEAFAASYSEHTGGAEEAGR